MSELESKKLAALKQKLQQTSNEPNPYAYLEKEFYEIEQKKTFLQGLIQDIQERKKYAQLIYIMIVIWLITILVIIFLSGSRLLHLSDAVLITIITTTTANIAAFFLGVIRYLFPNNSKLGLKGED